MIRNTNKTCVHPLASLEVYEQNLNFVKNIHKRGKLLRANISGTNIFFEKYIFFHSFIWLHLDLIILYLLRVKYTLGVCTNYKQRINK